MAHTGFREFRCDALTSPGGFYSPYRLSAARSLTRRFRPVQSGIASAPSLTHRCGVAVREAWARPSSAVLGVVVGASAGGVPGRCGGELANFELARFSRWQSGHGFCTSALSTSGTASQRHGNRHALINFRYGDVQQLARVITCRYQAHQGQRL